MKNVKLEKAKKGWFLTIGDDVVKNRWAITNLEAWNLFKVLKDNIEIIQNELKEEKLDK